MICILSNNLNPYFNLAAEEYLLKNSEREVFMLWRCSPTVVVGKHQNALAEINYRFVKEKNVGVARRLTGGGAVYHDEGNINFTFISKGEKGRLVDFKKFLSPVIQVLGILGLRAMQGKKNEILLGDRKISGNAEHIHKTRILHHGTLLFNADLKFLSGALKVIPGKYHDKSVQSNRSQVTNIVDHLDKKISIEKFSTFFFNSFNEMTPGSVYHELDTDDLIAIEKLSHEKYQTWEWIYGYSPKYRFTNKFFVEKKLVELELVVEQGIIKTAKINGVFFTVQQAARLAELLIDKKHSETDIRKSIDTGFKNIFPVTLAEHIIEGFF